MREELEQKVIYQLQDSNNSEIDFDSVRDFEQWLSGKNVILRKTGENKYKATLTK